MALPLVFLLFLLGSGKRALSLSSGKGIMLLLLASARLLSDIQQSWRHGSVELDTSSSSSPWMECPISSLRTFGIAGRMITSGA